ncbi:hypothetical protein AALO_G00058400 [Alosa alosa]|uniref:Leucine-rich single-pass membrane protein 1 n=1 Tax=Alosa alosa TaxID=278164 RepID=A0AAV6H7T7_9TELE|nr:uncharacterized protein si:dkey-20d21.12 [Alosa sapidissima]XP_048097822.1 uncharacterized protein si:dkey-20d21.12 [Alosa alosa]KAG5282654.1 hypothetical protein AALO_G00058400 [Alosa alosa]
MSLLKTYSDGMLKQSPSSHPAFLSDGDLTEIQLHSVESINDLHRHHPEQKGGRPPLHPFSLSSNGNVSTPVLRTSARQTTRPPHDAVKYYPHILICASLSLLLVTLAVILFVIVKQASTVSSLSELLLQNQGHAQEVSELKHKMQLLERNLNATGH